MTDFTSDKKNRNDNETPESVIINTTDQQLLPENEKVRNLPDHLKQFIINQNYDNYTAIDHAVWRYVMRQNYNYLREHAHLVYFEGLDKTGIGVEKIPSISEMNEILESIGWGAVTVDGFIPPAAFMEYQAHQVLVIAADIRQVDHIEYTPAPDIIHEAAGHAPIIADQEYADYLQRFGAVGAKAMSSRLDIELYEAIRHLSILKEAYNSDPEEIKQAEKDVVDKQDNLGKPSEMALLSRLHWWTVEYGLIGSLDSPKIYGAGLLSSIGESSSCLKPEVKKIQYSIDAINYPFDITTKQPQLFVTSSFEHLNKVLDEFANTMAFKVGGLSGIKKAIECKSTATAVFSSGLQVSGIFSEIITDQNNEPAYLRTNSATALAYHDQKLQGHDKGYHQDGFGSPVGKIKGFDKPMEDCNISELDNSRVKIGKKIRLQFESGIIVNGFLEEIVTKHHKNILLTFTDCEVKYQDQVLFAPAWGKYDMAVGELIVSVFNSAADKDAFQQVSLVPRERTTKASYDAKSISLQNLYQQVRNCREDNTGIDNLPNIWAELSKNYPTDWLLPLEILEILERENIFPKLVLAISSFLENKSAEEKHLSKLIINGLNLH